MGNIVSNAKAKNIEINVPSELPKPPKNDTIKYKPSESLLTLWENISPGLLYRNISFFVGKPYHLFIFENNNFEEYENFELVKGCTSYHVFNIWDGTDGIIYVYELVNGKYAGQLVACCYGNFKIYIGKTMKELTKVAETLEWEDGDDDMERLFKGVFGDF
ncbi:hypothetical protein BCR36DRAFT_410560 [Piromyces finnis]|uniref:SMI1/KNR4 family protein n=1 Tax=Piromyces finnis TaxID=1754191 RepID=A0A1Y1VG60_9FUNG|nr:hypothetical protein BCR36DRAFT_410560 [Piromyces finnis]|eukprot:ORX54752.1 hypothetical protein BCR36DRAFT_410560 [Piromyces finnis]